MCLFFSLNISSIKIKVNHNDLRFTLFFHLFAFSLREIVCSLSGGHSAVELSMVGSESRGLVRKGSTFTAIIARAPATSLTESSTSAFPGLGALLGTLPVVGLRDGAVLVVRMGSSVFGPVGLPEFLGVVEIFSGGGDVSVSETNGRRGTSGGECNKSSNELHYFKYYYNWESNDFKGEAIFNNEIT